MTSKHVTENNPIMSSGAGTAPAARKAAPSRRSTRSTAQFETPAIAPHEPVATQAVAALAYSYWVARGCAGGSPEEDWLRAERELRESAGAATVNKATA